MAHPVTLFCESIEKQSAALGTASPSVHWIGSKYSSEVLPAVRSLGWSGDLHHPESRLEFLSLPRESRDGIFVEEIPEAWNGDLVQRLLATLFQGLKAGGHLFLGFRGQEMVAMLAWLRQAGFEALQQGESAGIKGILARRIGGQPH